MLTCIWSIIAARYETKSIQVTVAETEENLEDPASLCVYHPGNVDHYYTTLTCNTPMIGRHVQDNE